MDGIRKKAFERESESERITEATTCVFFYATNVDVNISQDRKRMKRS
jgi:hypothetical protein